MRQRYFGYRTRNPISQAAVEKVTFAANSQMHQAQKYTGI